MPRATPNDLSVNLLPSVPVNWDTKGYRSVQMVLDVRHWLQHFVVDSQAHNPVIIGHWIIHLSKLNAINRNESLVLLS